MSQNCRALHGMHGIADKQNRSVASQVGKKEMTRDVTWKAQAAKAHWQRCSLCGSLEIQLTSTQSFPETACYTRDGSHLMVLVCGVLDGLLQY